MGERFLSLFGGTGIICRLTICGRVAKVARSGDPPQQGSLLKEGTPRHSGGDEDMKDKLFGAIFIGFLFLFVSIGCGATKVNEYGNYSNNDIQAQSTAMPDPSMVTSQILLSLTITPIQPIVETLVEATTLEPETPSSQEMIDIPVRIFNTNLEVGNKTPLAWSNNGEWLAYTFGYSVWLVNTDHWDQAVKLLTVTLTSQEPYLDTPFLFWSPGDESLGFRLVKPIDSFTSAWWIARYDFATANMIVMWEGEPGNNPIPVDWNDKGITVKRNGEFWLFNPNHQTWTFYGGQSGFELNPQSAPMFVDSSRVVWGYPRTDGRIVIADLDKGIEPEVLDGIQLFNEFTYPISTPIPSPDGRYLAWIDNIIKEDDTPYHRIMRYDLETDTLHKLIDSDTNGDIGIGWDSLSWSPQSKLAFIAAARGKSPTIWILEFPLPLE